MTTMTEHAIADWRHESACRTEDPELFFPLPNDRQGLAQALEVCAVCPVREACLQWALESGQADGVAGGMSANQRKVLRRGGKPGASPRRLEPATPAEVRTGECRRCERAMVFSNHSVNGLLRHASRGLCCGCRKATRLDGTYTDYALACKPLDMAESVAVHEKHAALRAEGKSQRQIARELGLSLTSMYRRLEKAS